MHRIFVRFLPRSGRQPVFVAVVAIAVMVTGLVGLQITSAGSQASASTVAVSAGSGEKPAKYMHGIVVSAYPDASRAGVDILKKGGNAVDAAIAVQFALAVVYPSAGNIGGGGFMVIRTASGKADCLDYREEAPGRASHDMYLDASGKVTSDASTLGYLAAGIPGSVDGMEQAHKRYGKLPWRDLLDPAIALAGLGFALTRGEARNLNSNAATLRQINGSSCSFLSEKGEWKEGDKLKQPAMARTLKAIQDHGREGFYSGAVATSIVNDIKKGGGIITLDDLKAYHAIWRKPLTGFYRGVKIISMPPPSSGGIALLQLLASVEPYDLSRLGHNSAATIHLFTEAERRVYADRAYYLGDPDFVDMPVGTLISEAYNSERMKNFNSKRATPSTQIKAGQIPDYANLESHIHKEKLETTHFSVTDEAGNAVSITTTLNDGFGSKVVLPGTGMVLNNEMDDFSILPGHPNVYGLLGGEANSIQPYKRMLSSMTPTILEKDKKLLMVLGSPGGATIITTVFQTVVNVIDYKMSCQDAVSARRIHSQWLPDTVLTENGALTAPAAAALVKMGHAIDYTGPLKPQKGAGGIGRMDAILVGGGFMGGADPRGDDTAAGY